MSVDYEATRTVKQLVTNTVTEGNRVVLLPCLIEIIVPEGIGQVLVKNLPQLLRLALAVHDEAKNGIAPIPPDIVDIADSVLDEVEALAKEAEDNAEQASS